MKKIIYISDSIIPSKKANSVHVMKMSQAFVSNGHELVLICRKGKEEIDDYDYYGVKRGFGIKKNYWPKIKGGGLVYGFLIKRFLSRISLDTMIYGRCIYGILSAAKKGFDCIFEVHSVPRNSFHLEMERKLFSFKNFKRLVVISRALADEYIKIFPELKNKNVVVAHDGADIPSGDYKKIELKGKNALKVGYIGSLYPGRGIDLIISLARRCGHFDFHIVGGDNESIEKWKKESEGLFNLYFHGFIPHKDIASYMNEFDIVLAPYQEKVFTSETKKISTVKWMSPLKVFEYMSYGKAIVCSDLKVLREVLENKKDSLLCDPVKIEEWAEALDLLRDQNIRFSLGERAKENFLENYTWKKRAEIIIKDIN